MAILLCQQHPPRIRRDDEDQLARWVAARKVQTLYADNVQMYAVKPPR